MRLFVRLFLLTVLGFAVPLLQNEGTLGIAMDQPSSGVIEAIIKLDKTTCRIGDTVNLSCSLTNKTKRELKILPTRRYAVHWLRVVSADGKPMREILSVIIDWNESLAADEIVVLKPNESYTRRLTGRAVQGKQRDLSHAEKIDGTFLDFKDSAVLLAGPGIYSISLRFESKDSKGATSQEVWEGSVESVPVVLRIER